MRVLVCGSREAPVRPMKAKLYAWLDALSSDQTIKTIIHGDCPGSPDLWGRDWADQAYEIVKVDPHPANWKLYGNGAGQIRNQEMVDICDIVVAVWDGKSTGTLGTIRKARLAKKPTVILYF